jgi:hypothetical protein
MTLPSTVAAGVGCCAAAESLSASSQKAMIPNVRRLSFCTRFLHGPAACLGSVARALHYTADYTDSACATNSLDIAGACENVHRDTRRTVQAAKIKGQAMTFLVKTKLPKGEKLLTMYPLSRT